MRDVEQFEFGRFISSSFERRRMMHPEKSIANVGIDAMTENIYINSDIDDVPSIHSRPLDKKFIEDILFLTYNNNNEVFHSIAPITVIRGKTYHTMNRQFINIEEVIDYFSQIKNNIICFYQMVVTKTLIPETLFRIRILIRYDAKSGDFIASSNSRYFHNLKVIKERNEFFKKEEFIL